MLFSTRTEKLKVLLIIEQCNPAGVSVPLVGYHFYKGISELCDVTLVTHARNKESLERCHGELRDGRKIVYLHESELARRYYRWVARLTSFKGKIIWPLRLALAYPIYAEFNRGVYARFEGAIACGEYDVVHAITPMMPRYPVKVVRACDRSPGGTPFILGPVNGGIPFPQGFRSLARREFAGLNFLRWVGRAVIPGYRETYRKADKILVGSSYTAGLIKRLFGLPDAQVELFYENGLTHDFFRSFSRESPTGIVELLFVGRLVPYKGADILLDAIAQLGDDGRCSVRLTIVGDGPERGRLQRQVERLHLQSAVRFVGWVPHAKVPEFYQRADIFCFPSLREFGGAVVLEAMAHGLPCIVVHYGGVGEYVTAEAGFMIAPVSRAFIVDAIAQKIERLAGDPHLYRQMSKSAIDRAQEFSWERKAKSIVDLYRTQIQQPQQQPTSTAHWE